MSTPNFNTLRDLHNSANNLLDSPLVQQALVHHQQEKWVHEVSEASLKMLDLCGTTKDVLLLVKHHLQDLRSTFRRVASNIGESSSSSAVVADQQQVKSFTAHTLYRKKLRKEMVKCLRSLKRTNKRFTSSDLSVALVPLDHDLTVVVDVLGEVRVATMSIVESLVSLMSMPKPDQRKYFSNNKGSSSLASKLRRTNSLSFWEKSDSLMLQMANTRLDAVGIVIEDLEVELECIFRRLIQTRVLLLNILTN